MIAQLLGVARRLAGSLALRAVVTTALLVVVLGKLDWNEIVDKVLNGEPIFGLAAILCVVAALTVGAFRWDALLKSAGIPLRPREVGRIYAVTSFANSFLPTSVGGDVARPLMVSRERSVLARAATTVLIERLVALVALLALAWVGVAMEPADVSKGSYVALTVFSAGLVGAALLVAVRPKGVARLARNLTPARLAGSLNEGREVFNNLRQSPWTVLRVLAQSLGFQALVTMQIVFLARMIGADLAFGLAAVALALVTLATLAPISIGGFGVREGSYVVVLASGGVSHTDAVLISLLSVVVLLISTLPGAVELVRSGFAPALRSEQGA